MIGYARNLVFARGSGAQTSGPAGKAIHKLEQTLRSVHCSMQVGRCPGLRSLRPSCSARQGQSRQEVASSCSYRLGARREGQFQWTARRREVGARLSPHGAFEDPTTPADALPRESIELRTIAFHSA
jgi:hypothetical protein